MAWAIPIPRRGIRSLLILLTFLLGPYFLLRHLATISEPDYDDYDPHPSYFRPNARRDVDHPKAQERFEAPTKPKAKAQKKVGTRLPQHEFLANGLVKVNPRGQHPIYDLIEKGKENWDGKLRKASRTLREAVNEYRRRYGRAPPRGFDRW